MRTVWRIATDAPGYEADDLTGAGAKSTGGRWNAVGAPMVYTSENRALACLETVVHLNAGGLPLNRYLVKIDVPEAAWATATRFEPARRVGWDAEPAGRVSISFGSEWLRSGASLLLIVPSVIVAEEQNVLINPIHPDIKSVRAAKVRRWIYDPRFRAL